MSNISDYLLIEAELQRQVVDSIGFLTQLGVQIENFTIKEFNEHYHSFPSFLKLVRILSPYKKDIDALASLTEKAVSSGVCGSASTWNVAQLKNVCEWLKTKDGQVAVQSVYMARKLQKQARATNQTIGQAAWVAILQRQLNDFGRAKKDKNKLVAEFAPASLYVEPAQNEIELAAYQIYAELCKSNNIPAVAKDDHGITIAFGRCGHQARMNYMNRFCESAEKKFELRQYINNRILQLEEKYNKREATRLRILLAVADENEVAAKAVMADENEVAAKVEMLPDMESASKSKCGTGKGRSGKKRAYRESTFSCYNLRSKGGLSYNLRRKGGN